MPDAASVEMSSGMMTRSPMSAFGSGFSKSTDGRMRSSQRGSHQFHSCEHRHQRGHQNQPHHGGVDGDRHRARDAELRDQRHAREREADEHRDHDQRRAGDGAGAGAHAVGDGVAGVVGLQEPFADAGQQEDLVVHRQPERHREHQRRDRAVQRRDRPEAQVLQPAPLEDDDEAAVGRGHRQHRHQHALEREEHRPDGDQQHHERDQRDEPEHRGLGLRHPVVEVLDQRGRPADVDLRVGRPPPAAAARASSRRTRGRAMSSGSTDSTADTSALR